MMGCRGDKLINVSNGFYEEFQRQKVRLARELNFWPSNPQVSDMLVRELRRLKKNGR